MSVPSQFSARIASALNHPRNGALHDIHDPAAYVKDMVRRTGLHLTIAEREDLHAEGLLVMYRMATEEFDPHMAGYDRPGSFAGYCAKFFPRRLLKAWHRLNPEHRVIRHPDGKQRWHYYPRPMSLNEIIDDRSSSRQVYDHDDDVDSWMNGMRHLKDALPSPTPALIG